MRKVKGLIIGFVAALAAISCMKEDNTLRYNNSTMGNVVAGTFVSDQGNRFNVVEQNCKGRLDTMERAMVICDVLKATEGKTDEYDVRLNYLASVLVKDAISMEETAGMANDPVIMSDFWISGGCFNFYITVPVNVKEGKKHVMNLAYSRDPETGKYSFKLFHDASGEILKEDGNNSELKFASGYLSFPVTSIIKEDEAKVVMEWNSYVITDQFVSAKTNPVTKDIDYKKSNYDKKPSTNMGVY